MITETLRIFLWGAIATGSLVIGLFFLRFWRETRDALFLRFALAFWVLAANWTALALTPRADETREYYYVLRIVAFGLILWAIIAKNRQQRRDEADKI